MVWLRGRDLPLEVFSLAVLAMVDGYDGTEYSLIFQCRWRGRICMGRGKKGSCRR